MASTQFAFVSFEDGLNVTSLNRSQIRSHCMKGKNKRENSRRSIRQAKREAQEASQRQGKGLLDPKPKLPHQNSASTDVSTVSHVLGHRHSASARSSPESSSTEDGSLATPHWVSPPPPFHSTIVNFANSVYTSTADVLLKVIAFDKLTQAIYPVHSFIEYDPNQLFPNRWTEFDESFLHTVYLTSTAARDLAQRRPLARDSHFYLDTTLTYLNQKLCQGASGVSEFTLYTILCLAIIAAGTEDYEAVNAHALGLHRILRLREVKLSLEHDPMLRFKLDSFDLMCCLTFGRQPILSDLPISWDPCFLSLKNSRLITPAVFDEITDSRLLAVFDDLQYLAINATNRYAAHRKLDASVFQPALSSIQARLLHLKEGDCSGGLSEAVCLCMLAFLATMFRMPGRNQKAYNFASRRLRKCLLSLPAARNPAQRDFMSWMLMIGAVSILDADSAWLHTTWCAIMGTNAPWAELRRGFESVLWIGCLHDEFGKRAYSKFTDSTWANRTEIIDIQ